jgi:hypothetical protein
MCPRYHHARNYEKSYPVRRARTRRHVAIPFGHTIRPIPPMPPSSRSHDQVPKGTVAFLSPLKTPMIPELQNIIPDPPPTSIPLASPPPRTPSPSFFSHFKVFYTGRLHGCRDAAHFIVNFSCSPRHLCVIRSQYEAHKQFIADGPACEMVAFLGSKSRAVSGLGRLRPTW